MLDNIFAIVFYGISILISYIGLVFLCFFVLWHFAEILSHLFGDEDD